MYNGIATINASMINVETHTTTPHYLEELHELLYGELVSDLQVAYSVVLSAPEAYCDANGHLVDSSLGGEGSNLQKTYFFCPHPTTTCARIRL